MSRYAERRSFEYCAETCPAVGKITSAFVNDEFENFVDRIKEATSGKLRDALNSACADLIAAEEKIAELDREVVRMDHEISDLRDRIRELESEVSA